MTITRIGILGGGPLGRAVARTMARTGIQTAFHSGPSEEPVSGLADELPGMLTEATLQQAAEEEIVLLSVAWADLVDTMAAIADWEGRILIDATDPVLPKAELADLEGRTSSEVVSDLAPGAQFVKAFNTLPPELLAAEPERVGGRRVLFLSGDHVRAKAEVGRLIRQIGFASIDLGGLVDGGKLQQFPNGPLRGLNLIKLEE
jgi:8-hydroxy-5-deazaflavin:NADPH oxidoreductase